MTVRRIELALISVSDKTGVVEFARGLAEMGVKILSSGGTARALHAAGLAVTEVSDHTGAPEILGGRVKTLHPKIHGGILARISDPEHRADMERMGIDPIDLVVVNLYPFEESVGEGDVSMAEAIEEIDIGGVALLRAAAKNHERVAVVTGPEQYEPLLRKIRESNGSLSAQTRLDLARAAFRRTSSYDAAISTYLAGEEAFPQSGTLILEKVRDLRYGENPYQEAALYGLGRLTGGVASARILGGKEVSYNNILDLSAASALAQDLEDPGCVIVKHTNPCGAALGETLVEAFRKAHDCDPISAFGSVVAFNRPLDGDCAGEMVAAAQFVEAVIAPGVPPAAVDVLKGARWGKSVRILEGETPPDLPEMRSVSGGLLAQRGAPPPLEEKVATKRAPTDEEWKDLRFAWKVVRHVKSNAIVLARGGATVGVGAGQMSRVDSVVVAARKAGDRARGASLASDGFFPFPDGLEAAAAAGVTAAIQPGGSRRDPQVIEAADRLGIALVHTGVRHFLH